MGERGIFRFESDRLVDIGQSAGIVAGLLVAGRTVLVIEPLRIEPDRRTIIGNRSGVLSRAHAHNPPAIVRLGVVGIGFKRFVEGLPRRRRTGIDATRRSPRWYSCSRTWLHPQNRLAASIPAAAIRKIFDFILNGNRVIDSAPPVTGLRFLHDGGAPLPKRSPNPREVSANYRIWLPQAPCSAPIANFLSCENVVRGVRAAPPTL
jgi:hypothetical protein